MLARWRQFIRLKVHHPLGCHLARCGDARCVIDDWQQVTCTRCLARVEPLRIVRVQGQRENTMTNASKKLGRLQRDLLVYIHYRVAEVEDVLRGDVGHVSLHSGRSRCDPRISIHWRNVGFTRSESAAICRALKTLESRGLVERSNTVSGGRRTTNVQLTSEGERLAKTLTM